MTVQIPEELACGYVLHDLVGEPLADYFTLGGIKPGITLAVHRLLAWLHRYLGAPKWAALFDCVGGPPTRWRAGR